MDGRIGNPSEELRFVIFQSQADDASLHVCLSYAPCMPAEMHEKGKDAEDGAPNGRKLISPGAAGRLPGIDGEDHLMFKEDSKKELLRSGDTSTDSSVSTHDGKFQDASGGKLNTSQATVVPTCDWSDKVGAPIKQHDNTCIISACIMCMEALHRIAYEKIHGAGSFSCNVADTAAHELKEKMIIGKAGAFPDEVLDKISSNNGLPTVDNIIRLTCKYEMCYIPSHEKILEMLTQGPVVGGMVYGAGYRDTQGDLVYEGFKEGEIPTPHAVVCVSYKFEGDELLIKVIDNQEQSGPVRWVNHKAFQMFTVIKVDPVDNRKS